MLISNIEELRLLLPSVMLQDFERFNTAAKIAEDWLRGVLGQELYESAVLSPELEDKCKLIVACRAYYNLIPELDVVNSLNGFAIVNDSKLAPASRERVAALRESVRIKGLTTEASLYEAFEDNLALYELWSKRTQTTIIKGSLTPTLREFQKHAEFNGGYDEWRSSRFKHFEVIVTRVASVISAAVVARIIEADDRYKDVANMVRTAFVGHFNGNDMVAKHLLFDVRAILMSDPEKYPEFKNSTSSYQRQTPQSSDAVGIFV